MKNLTSSLLRLEIEKQKLYIETKAQNCLINEENLNNEKKEDRKGSSASDITTQTMSRQVTNIPSERELRQKRVQECKQKCYYLAVSKYSGKEHRDKWIGFFVEWLEDPSKEPQIVSSRFDLYKYGKGDYFCRQIGKLIENQPECIEYITDVSM